MLLQPMLGALPLAHTAVGVAAAAAGAVGVLFARRILSVHRVY